MKASQIDNRQEELFQPRLSGQLNQKNELLVLSRMIPWDDLEIEFPTDSKLYNKARKRLAKLAAKNGIKLRQKLQPHR